YYDLTEHYVFPSKEHRPELLFLFGDRQESLIAAAAAVYHNIPIAHIEGGDTSGTQDDIVRGMITKSANLHFVGTGDAKWNVFHMDESLERIFKVGDLHIDPIMEYLRDMPPGAHKNPDPGIIILQHPDDSIHGGFVLVIDGDIVSGFQFQFP
ncbi:MAG: UDP-N-acetylglucosamine 2-epimerase, partial [Chloroflexi bacterium]|nr:UDP-N-acetylglucosamine 2-epimerase [Chloroflexota bacterium]